MFSVPGGRGAGPRADGGAAGGAPESRGPGAGLGAGPLHRALIQNIVRLRLGQQVGYVC